MRSVVPTSVALGVAAVLLASPASATDRTELVDTSYGRIEGDLSFGAGVGSAFGPRGPRAALDLRLRYLWTAGLFVTYEDGPLWSSEAEPRRAFATGIELRPLFLARWANGYELGNPWLDLAIDSIGLEVGAAFVEPRGRPFGKTPSLQAGIGLQVPVLGRASGPQIGVHAGARWSTASLAGDTINLAGDRSGYLLLTIAWQQVFGAHVVDLGDRADR